MKELTLTRIRHTSFHAIYKKLVLGIEMTPIEYKKMLSVAVLFINNGTDPDVIHLGYRILVLYSNQTKDYKPLYDIALNQGLIPIVKTIENMQVYQENFNKSFFKMLYSAFSETYKTNEMYLTEQQKELFDFFETTQKKTVAIVAPTSYGKSGLIVLALQKRTTENVCIVVPTKALLAQTKKRLLNAGLSNITKIITHPEMYVVGEQNLVAVLTQERLLRLLKKNTNVSFDWVFVDEAHNLLVNDSRNILLSIALSILEKRNSKVVYKFLTPFLIDCSNLHIKHTRYVAESFSINEYIKTEKFYLYDFRNNKRMQIYDQFLNSFFYVDGETYIDEIELIRKRQGAKNIVYLNKPRDLEKFAIELSKQLDDVHSTHIDVACNELSKYFHRDYFLINCLRKGIIYHHGSVPDNVRAYIESLFSCQNEVRFVVTSSTLLEGVNLPADKLFLLDNKKGNGNLRPSSFKNLAGRICRFKEMFFKGADELSKLEPEIFLIGSEYMAQNANLENFIKQCAQVDLKIHDDPKNLLLKNIDVSVENSTNIEKLQEIEQFMENFESGLVNEYSGYYAKTEVGKICFANSLLEIDIVSYEQQMQLAVDNNKLRIIDNASGVFDIFVEVFLPYIMPNEKYNNLTRLENEEARQFYQMLLEWKIENVSYPQMINNFLRYWHGIELGNGDTLIYVGRWGDKKRDGHKNLWSDIKQKNFVERINLAIVRIKEEQDFLENVFMKYIEALNDFGFLETEFYEKLKYGTSNKQKIVLMKNGLSSNLSSLIVDKYAEYITVDVVSSMAKFKATVIDDMVGNGENAILIHEMKSNTQLF